MARPPSDPRPQLTRPIERLLADLVARCAPLEGLDAGALLVVAEGAHGRAAASVRSLDEVAASVMIGRAVRRAELALRPPFFAGGDATARLTTLLHELLHLDPDKPGALLETRRHRRRSHEEHEAHARALAQQWLDDADLALLAPLGHEGEVLVRSWIHRPVAGCESQKFTDSDVFLRPVRVSTPKRLRTAWW